MTDQAPIPLVHPDEVQTPGLDQHERFLFVSALNWLLMGGGVQVACTYSKQTSAKPRIGGRDYICLPGVSPESQIGPLTTVDRRKKDRHVYFRVWSFTRQDWVSMQPEGLTGFVVMQTTDPAEVRAALERQAALAQATIATNSDPGETD